jgi:hypothetical protein
MEFYYQRGWDDILGSNANFDKWQFSVWDDVNFKLRGLLRFRFSIGGFLNSTSVYLQDYQHFNGNQTIVASEYLNSFQLAPYYANSTTARFYAMGHLEHHFNGLLTNKIPLFRRLNWNLVGAPMRGKSTGRIIMRRCSADWRISSKSCGSTWSGPG